MAIKSRRRSLRRGNLLRDSDTDMLGDDPGMDSSDDTIVPEAKN
jgi:hypothetical protein